MADISNDAQSILTITQVLAANQAARFAYTSVAYEDDDAAGVASYDYTKEQNIPLKGEDYVMMKSGVLDKGLRTQGASLPREFLDHMLGRLSYNLNKLVDKFNALVTLYKTDLSQNANLYSPTASYSTGCVCFMLTTKNTTSLECEFFRCIASSSITGTPPISSGGVYDTANWEQCTYTKYSIDTMLASAIATEVTNRNSAIAVETAARTAADSNLNTAISNEASTRSSADAAIQNQIDTEVLKNNLGFYAWSSIDSLTQGGVYRVRNESATATFTLLVFGTESGGDTNTIQYIFGFNSGYCQWRNKTSGNNWTAWKTVFNTQNIDSSPTSGSPSVPSSGGVYTSEQSKENFTFVIDSDSKFAAWAAATAGNDYTSVLVKKGTWTLASGGVDLTAAGTKLVAGEAGSLLVFSSSSYGIEYSSQPSYTDHAIRNVNISVNTGSISTSPSGFINCVNLINCHCDVYNSELLIGDSACFMSCNNLKNCTGQAHATNSLVGYVFSSCTYLEGCIATLDSATASTLHGFANCSFITNCTATGTGTLTGSTPNYMYGFTACTYVTNSACTITTTKGSIGFSSCYELTNCMAQITSTYNSSDTDGFSNCTNVMNCKATVSGAGDSHVASGFAACTRLTNCGGSATNSGNDGTGYGFYYCYGMLENYPSGTTTTSAYSNCYATSDIESSYAVAHTPAGGFNRLTL